MKIRKFDFGYFYGRNHEAKVNYLAEMMALFIDTHNARDDAGAATPTTFPDSPGCSLSGPGRGDCEHFIGLPMNPSDVDEYGKPNGWCWFCWNRHLIDQRDKRIEELVESKRISDEAITSLTNRLGDADNMIAELKAEKNSLEAEIGMLKMGFRPGPDPKLEPEKLRCFECRMRVHNPVGPVENMCKLTGSRVYDFEGERCTFASCVRNGGSILTVEAGMVGVVLMREEAKHKICCPSNHSDLCLICKSGNIKLRKAMEVKPTDEVERVE